MKQATSRKDMGALQKLYHPEAVIESPLISHLLKIESGICQDSANLRRTDDFVEVMEVQDGLIHHRGYWG